VLAIFVVAAWMLALFNGLYLAPWSMLHWGALKISSLGRRFLLKFNPAFSTKAFPNACSMCRTCTPAQGAAVWKGVFLADISDPANPSIYAGSLRASSSPRGRIACICI